jgi:hypothetical protein
MFKSLQYYDMIKGLINIVKRCIASVLVWLKSIETNYSSLKR